MFRTSSVHLQERFLQYQVNKPATAQIPTEPIQARGWIVNSNVHELINSISNKEEMTQKW